MNNRVIVQVRPVIYGFELRYQAYFVNTKTHPIYKRFLGIVYKSDHEDILEEELIHWREGKLGEYVLCNNGYYSEEIRGKIRSTFDNLKQAEEVLESLFGSELDRLAWSPK